MPAPRRILVTGATSGLGRAMAEQLAAEGAWLAVTGRRAGRLEETAEAARANGAVGVLALAGSVDDPADVRRHHEAIVAAAGGLDVAILNAGVGVSNDGRAFDAEPYRRGLATNVLGACHWLERVVPGMIEQGSGIIAGISSPAGWRGFPAIGPYAASKAALSTLLESLRVDLRGTGVDVVIVCPGFVRSEMTAANDERSMPGLLETADGAARILRGIDRRRRVVHFPRRLTWPLRIGTLLLPGAVTDRLAARARASIPCRATREPESAGPRSR